jgi:hypothetical protein
MQQQQQQQPAKAYFEANCNYNQITSDASNEKVPLNNDLSGFQMAAAAATATPNSIDSLAYTLCSEYAHTTSTMKRIKNENNNGETGGDEYRVGTRRRQTPTTTQLIKEIYPWMKDNRHVALSSSSSSSMHLSNLTNSFNTIANSSTSSSASSSTNETTIANRGDYAHLVFHSFI